MNHYIGKVLSQQKHYTVIPNACLRDQAISFKAKGLLAWLLSHQDDFEFKMEFLYQASKDGRRSVDSALAELENAGYVVSCRTRYGNRYHGRMIVVTDSPELTTADEMIGCLQEIAEAKNVDLHKTELEDVKAKFLLCKNASRVQKLDKMHTEIGQNAHRNWTKCTTKKDQRKNNKEKHQRARASEHTREAPQKSSSEEMFSKMDSDQSMPDRGDREPLPETQRADFAMFKQEWSRIFKQQWDSARNGDLLLYVLRYWTREELHQVMKTLEKKRRTITNPLAYFMSALERISVASTTQSKEMTWGDLINHKPERTGLSAEATEAQDTHTDNPPTLESLLELYEGAKLTGIERHIKIIADQIQTYYPQHIIEESHQ